MFDSKKAKHARSGKVAPRVFRERDGVREISVDRLTIADSQVLIKHHDQQRAPQRLHGWAQLSLQDAMGMNRQVLAAPLDGNPWHAEIIIPETDPTELADAQDQHALNLAMRSSWLERPSA